LGGAEGSESDPREKEEATVDLKPYSEKKAVLVSKNGGRGGGREGRNDLLSLLVWWGRDHPISSSEERPLGRFPGFSLM